MAGHAVLLPAAERLPEAAVGRRALHKYHRVRQKHERLYFWPVAEGRWVIMTPERETKVVTLQVGGTYSDIRPYDGRQPSSPVARRPLAARSWAMTVPLGGS